MQHRITGVTFLFILIILISGCASKDKLVKTETEKVLISSKNQIKNEDKNRNIEEGKVEDSEKPKITETYKKEQSKSIINTINELEKCYETGDFEKWKSLLTPSYIEKYNNPDYLKKNGWNADNLKSFFFLLIETREKNGIESLPISRVEFVSPVKAYVYVLYKGKEFPKPQHTFIRIGNSWYKGLPDEGD